MYRVVTRAAAAWDRAKVKPGVRPLQPAVARSFGDLELKQPTAFLSSIPDVAVHALAPGAAVHVVLACDGVWDVLDNAGVAALAAGAAAHGLSLRDRAGAVVKAAYERGSTDNISAIVVRIECSSAPP